MARDPPDAPSSITSTPNPRHLPPPPTPPQYIKPSISNPNSPYDSISRHQSWLDNDRSNPGSPFTQLGSLPTTTTSNPTNARKRSADRMTSVSSTAGAMGPTSNDSGNQMASARKGRACLACRRLKVKCDSLERGSQGCSRCQRLGLECVTSKRLRVSLEDDPGGGDGEGSRGAGYAALARLDRAVEDILAKLKMPSLETYAPPNTASMGSGGQHVPESIAQTTRENSHEPLPEGGEGEMADAPMGSLYEATQLNSLRARLKHGDPARRSSKRKMELDLVSLGHITLEDAEEMFDLFKTSLSRYLFDATISEDRTLQSVRESSTLFFTAIMVVTSLHIPGKEKVHLLAHKSLRDLIAASMFDRFHTLEDIRGLCIAAFWSPDLSWKLSGHCVRMATELNLHQAFFKALYSLKQTPKDRKDAFERARLWYLLYVLDHHFSIAYGRPPVTAELQAIKEYEVFLGAPECTMSDRRVISQVTLFIILSKAYGVFGLEAERLMEGDDVSLLTHARFMEDLDRWRFQFRHALSRDVHVGDYPAIGVELHYNFASMMLNSIALRGRSLASISTSLPSPLRPLALRAIESAHQILQIVLDEPSIKDSLVGVPLYLHTMIAFAVVFLIKMSSRWKAIGVTIDAETRTKPLIEGIINAMRACKAGANHILYSMASGFERLLARNLNGLNGDQSTNTAGEKAPRMGLSIPSQQQPQQYSADSNGQHLSTASLLTGQTQDFHRASQQFDPQRPGMTRNGSTTTTYEPTYGISPSAFGGWQTEDDMLWSMGMGYDLLANQPDVVAAGIGSAYPGLGIGQGGSYGDMLYPSGGL